MRAYELERFGGPAVLTPVERPRPEPGVGEVRVRVMATSVNPLDCRVRQDGAGMVELPARLGYDVSGVVDALGPGVERFAVGDAVFYTPRLFEPGSYAEYHVEQAAIVAAKPPSLSHAEAASLPVVACTAWAALFDRAGVGLGDRVLVHGGGGVGSMAIQLAAAAGARPVCVTGAATLAQAERLGATLAVDYREGPFAERLAEEPAFDVVLSTVGGSAPAESVELMAAGGTIVDVVGEAAGVGGPAKLRNVTVEFMALERARATLEAVADVVAAGQLEPVIDRVYPLAEVAQAHRDLEAGGRTGKLVLTVDS
jgi:NADPH2:quinone reductase